MTCMLMTVSMVIQIIKIVDRHSPFDDFPELLRAVCVIHYLHKIFNWRYEIQSKVGG